MLRVRRVAAPVLVGLGGVVGSMAYTWLLLTMLGSWSSSDGLLSTVFSSSGSGVATATAAATGAPIHWWMPSLRVGGTLWPVQLLAARSPLALLGLAPLCGAVVMAVSLHAYAHRRGPVAMRTLVVGSSGSYALVLAGLAALADGRNALSSLTEAGTNPWLVAPLALLWSLAGTSAALVLLPRRALAMGLAYRRNVSAVMVGVLVLAMLVLTGSQNRPPSTSTPAAEAGVTKVENAPAGARRRGVAEAVAALKAQSGGSFLETDDPWRGVPEALALRSPVGASVSTWLSTHAGVFATPDPTARLQAVKTETDKLGRRHVWFDQFENGVPVFDARVGVHLDPSGQTVTGLTNGMQPALVVTDTHPTVAVASAIAVAQRAMPGGRSLTAPTLTLLPDDPYPDHPTAATLSWRVVVGQPNGGGDGTWSYFVSAVGVPRIVRALPVSANELVRRVWDYHNQPTDPQGPPARDEGQPPTSVADVNAAYDYSGDFYRYYHDVFGRDSYDGNGAAPLLNMVRYRDFADEPYLNAYWNGVSRVFFGENVVTREIVGHEWTHAVVQSTANLEYQDQSGALNESFADIFGESIEQFATGSHNWLIGSGSALGVIRSFSNPPDYGQPDNMHDYVLGCGDSGGVHTNSGIPNKAFYVLSNRIGMTKASAVAYRALTTYLVPTSTFNAARAGEIQAAWDLYGKDSQEAIEVWRAWGSVGVDGAIQIPRVECNCFAESSLHGAGLNALDPKGTPLDGVTAALLRTRSLLTAGSGAAYAHYGMVYQQANPLAVKLMLADPSLQQATAHAMQSFAPVLAAVDSDAGDQQLVSAGLIDELNKLVDDFISADVSHGDGQLAPLLTAERARIDTAHMAGMTANEALAYLDQIASTGPAPGSVPGIHSAIVDPQVQQTLSRAGRADVFVMFGQRADLHGAAAIADHGKKASYVFRQLGLTAQRSQKDIASLLSEQRVKFEQFWIVNAVLVHDADQALIAKLAKRGEVSRIRLSGAVPMQPMTAAEKTAAVDGVEWGVDRIRAPKVWSDFGDTGQDIVVANIDTGVDFDHPALVAKYRGTKPDGTFDHNYNWFDPAGICGATANGPCDNHNHGSHTMGTMVGDGGIGVAPGAKWIAAKGCESGSCSDASLLASGQWVMAPTDVNGMNPRPELAPNIVNNSWGGQSADPFYQDIVDAWVQAGIFPAFANGNAGPRCDTSISPGDYPNAFSVGAFDSNNAIAYFSSRGPSEYGGVGKPNISAPGVNVRSSVAGGGYATYSGTSMATPHLAATVALMWSAAPSLVGDIAATRQILEQTAIDMPDVTCGGTDADNFVWGEGRLDAYNAVAFSPRGPSGSVIGTLSDSHGVPLAGAQIVATSGASASRTTTTDEGGSYSLHLPVGTYQISASAFGFQTATASVTVPENDNVRRDIVALMTPHYSVVGQVVHDGVPVKAGFVSAPGTPLADAPIGADGGFVFTNVPVGTYQLTYSGGACAAATSISLTVDWDESPVIAANDLTDGAGYRCGEVTADFPATTQTVALSGDDAAAAVALPFTFPYYGSFYSTAYVSTNGSLNFERPNPLAVNAPLPDSGPPSTAIYPFWDDLLVDGASQVRTGLTGSAPARTFTIEWRNVALAADPNQRMTFAVTLNEGGTLAFHYGTLSDSPLARGGTASVGIEDSSGSLGIGYLFHQPVLHSGSAIEFRGVGMVQGLVTTADGTPLANSTVSTGLSQMATTDISGHYKVALATGTHRLYYNHTDYRQGVADVTIAHDGDVVTWNQVLKPLHNKVHGYVRDDTGRPIAGVPLSAGGYGYPIVTTTGPDGGYSFDDIAAGTYTFMMSQICLRSLNQQVTVDADMTLDLTVYRESDHYGNTCRLTSPDSSAPTTVLPLSGDNANLQIPLPFGVPFYGTTYNSVTVSTDGMISFTGNGGPPGYGDWWGIPSWWAPNGAVYVWWDDLLVDAQSSVRADTLGSGTDLRFVIEWHNAAFAADPTQRLTVQVVLYPDGRIRTQYPSQPITIQTYAGIGIESPDGQSGLDPSWLNYWHDPGRAIEFHPPGM